MAHLVFLSGARMGHAVSLGFTGSIGSGTDNSIPLPDAELLGRHAIFSRQGGATSIQRARPDALFQVNGRAVIRETLRHGDVISLGTVSLLFAEDEIPDPATAAPLPPAEPRVQPVHSRLGPFADAESTVLALRKSTRVRELFETLYRVGAALNSIQNLEDLREELIGQIFSSFQPDRCSLVLYDLHGKLTVEGERRSPRAQGPEFRRVSQTIVNEVLEKREAITTHSAVSDGRFSLGQSIVDQQIQSVMCAPVVRKDRLLGVIYVDNLAAREPYEQEDLMLLNAIAAQASVAIENALNLEREVSFRRSLIRLGESAQRLSALLTRDRLVGEAVVQISGFLECQKVSLLLFDRAAGVLSVAASNHIAPEEWPSIRIRPGEGFAGRAFQEGRPLLRNEPAGADRSAWRVYESSPFLISPIFSHENGLEPEAQPMGLVCATDKAETRPFSPHDQELLRIFCAQLGIALHNTTLFERATVDRLTQLFTRQYFDVRLEQGVHSHLAQGSPLAILMCDLDHFKEKNDLYGHPAGDQILRTAAGLLKSCVGARGEAGRYGGEEFAVILPSRTADQARDLAEEIRRSLERHGFQIQGQAIRCTMSIGIGTLEPNDSPETVIARADAALYAAKRKGRNRVEPQAGPELS